MRRVASAGRFALALTIETVHSQTVAAVAGTCTMDEMPEAMGRGFGRIMEVLGAQGAAPLGPPLTIYPDPRSGDGPMTFQTAIPVPPGATGEGEVQILTIPEGPVAVYLHQGPYTELGATYSRAMAEIREAGLPLGGPPREIYLNDPSDTAPERLLTRIEFPVFEPD